jgi:polyhydroxybutyrate depolymerase
MGHTMRGTLGAACALLALVPACSNQSMVATDAGTDAPDDAAENDAAHVARDAGPHFDVGTAARPASVVIPSAYDGTTPLPLIVLLHGDGVTGVAEDAYLHMSQVTRSSGAYLVAPNGTMSTDGFLEWNDGYVFTTSADDVAYLSTVLDNTEAMLPVDTHRVYFVGHANGGFMAYRVACELSARVTGILAIEAGDYPNDFDCSPAPSRPVSVLHVHGTADSVTPYDGVVGRFAGAVESTQRWAQRASCDVTMTHVGAPFDLDGTATGDETTATNYVVGCTGARVSLFTMMGSMHIPSFPQSSTQVMVDWLLAQTSP